MYNSHSLTRIKCKITLIGTMRYWFMITGLTSILDKLQIITQTLYAIHIFCNYDIEYLKQYC